jgi:hypothetical protein
VKLDRISPGDIVLCSIGGRRVYGEVREVAEGVVYFTPISPNAGWRHAAPRQIIGHWRKSWRSRRQGEPAEPARSGEDSHAQAQLFEH